MISDAAGESSRRAAQTVVSAVVTERSTTDPPPPARSARSKFHRQDGPQGRVIWSEPSLLAGDVTG